MTKMRWIAALTAIAISAATAAGCGAATRPPQRPAAVLTSGQVAALRDYGTGDTAFGLNVLSTLCARRPRANAVISPVSLATGLGMAFLGARGRTAAAMARVLHLPTARLGRVNGLRARSALLRSLDSPGVTFTTSNRIWTDPTLSTRRGFVAALRSAYQAGLTHWPLLSAPEQARSRINAAIAADTRGHIPNLLPPGSLSEPPIGWVLTDALYLNARWQRPFEHALTRPGSFAAAGGQVTAKYLDGGPFTLAGAAGWTAVALPYRGGRLSMLALLPPTGGSGGCQLPDMRAVSALSSRLAGSKSVTDVMLPKVSLAASESLQDVLTSLGMGIAFSGGADFSGLSPQACCIGFVQHAATLAVAEKGTIASAATAVGMEPSAAHVSLAFDRPYLLMLRDSLTGEPLMLAWVANPAAG